MDLKKGKHFTPTEEDSTFFKRRKSETINKELFPCKFVCFLVVSLFKRTKDSALVKFYKAAVRYFLETFRKFAGKSL